MISITQTNNLTHKCTHISHMSLWWYTFGLRALRTHANHSFPDVGQVPLCLCLTCDFFRKACSCACFCWHILFFNRLFTCLLLIQTFIVCKNGFSVKKLCLKESSPGTPPEVWNRWFDQNSKNRFGQKRHWKCRKASGARSIQRSGPGPSQGQTPGHTRPPTNW